MTFPSRSRRKKPVKLLGATKIVRINASTQVEVSVSLSEEEAKRRYIARHTPPERKITAIGYPLTPDEAEIKPDTLLTDEIIESDGDEE